MSDYNRIANLVAENARLRELVKELTNILEEIDRFRVYGYGDDESCVVIGLGHYNDDAIARLVIKAKEVVE